MYFSDGGHENVFLATFLLRSPRYFARRHSHYLTNLNISRNTVSWMFENVFILMATMVMDDLMTLIN